MSWSAAQPWVVAEAGPSAWEPVAAALAAAGGARVAAVVVGEAEADLLRSAVTTYVAVPVAARADDVVRVATALVPAHDRVVVTAPGGLLAPLGGFTLADVAWALRAPVVVAAGPGAAHDVLLTLEVLEQRHVPAAVVAIEPTDDLPDLPVELAGTIPADAADLPDFADRAPGWLDPLLKGAPPAEEPVPDRSRRTFTGKRVAIAVLILIVAALQALYMISLFGDEPRAAEPEYQPLRGYVDVQTAVPAPVAAPCTPGAPVAVPAAPDPATTARVNAAWTRIEAALAAKAPMVAASLRPGATTDALARAQALIGAAFPADLAASLLRHDGTVTRAGFEFPPFHRYIGLDDMYREWLSSCRALGGRADGVVWHRLFVPFAEAGDGGSLVVDQRPGMGGRVGDYFPEEGTRFDNRPRSFVDLLEAVATSLETGTPYAGRYRPVTMPDGTLDWQF